MPGDDEQRVVDSHAQADHRRQRRRDRGNGHHVAQQANNRERDARAKIAVTIGKSIATIVPKVNVKITIAAMIPISSLDSVEGCDTF